MGHHVPLLPPHHAVACIYNVDGRCKGVLTPERLNLVRRAFKKTKYSGLHDNIHPPPSLASELVGLITRKVTATFRHTSHKIKIHGCFFMGAWQVGTQA